MQITYTLNQTQQVLNAININGTPLNIVMHEKTYGPFSINFSDYIHENQTPIRYAKSYSETVMGVIFGAPIIKDNNKVFGEIYVIWE